MRYVLLIVFSCYAASSLAFGSFDDESDKVTDQIKCANPKITPGSGSWGALYGCVGGRSETVKFFINENPINGQVKNVKFLWNDWTRDGGYGEHADEALARAWVSVLGVMYAPQKVDQVLDAFSGTTETLVNGESHLLKYTYHSGPGIDERMFVVVKE